jgi:hypothetical protein
VRWVLIAIAVAFLGGASAFAKPRGAVTPVDGDSGDKMGEAVRDLLGDKLAVVAPEDVDRAMSKLRVSGELEEDEILRLRQRLDAAVVVQGKLGRAGKKKTVKLTVWVRGKQPSVFNVQYKSVGSEKFREVVREALLKRIGSIDDLAEGEEKPKKKKVASADDDDDDGDDDGDRPKKKKKKKVASADDDDDDDDAKPKARKRKRGRDDDDGDGEGVREQPARPLPAARVDAGLSFAARYLTYTVASDSTTRPPKVLTPAPAGRFEGELYPLALSNRESPLAGLGIFGEYNKTVGLSIDVPNTMGKSAPINQAHYAIGARYRLALGKSAISGGVAYARRHYIADRSSLAQPTQLDTPDVDYAAISPVIGGRTQVAPRVALFAELDAMLVLSAGAIAKADNYGSGDVFGIGGNGGVDIALGKQLGLRFAAEYNQVNLTFKGTGAMAARKVSAATDRDIGGSATLAAMF